MSYLKAFWLKIKTNPKKSGLALITAIGAGAEALGYHQISTAVTEILGALGGLF